MRLITAIALLVVCAYAAEQSPEGHDERGIALHRDGKYAAAEQEHRKAIELHEAAGDTRSAGYAGSLNNLAATLQSQGKAAEARTALMRTLALEPTLGDHEVIVYALNNLAFAHHAEREFPQAIALLRR